MGISMIVTEAQLVPACLESCVKNAFVSPNSPKCVRSRSFTPIRSAPGTPTKAIKQAIDSLKGRHMYSQRFGTVEHEYANIRHTKSLNLLTLRGRTKVNTQWYT
jgi:Transposase DDE domain